MCVVLCGRVRRDVWGSWEGSAAKGCSPRVEWWEKGRRAAEQGRKAAHTCCTGSVRGSVLHGVRGDFPTGKAGARGAFPPIL